MKKLILISILFIIFNNSALAQSNPESIAGVWINESQTRKVEVYKTMDNKYEGKIVWLKDDAGKSGVGEVVIKDLAYDEGSYKNGKVYAEKAGGWINCQASLQNDTTLRLTATKMVFRKSKLYHKVDK